MSIDDLLDKLEKAEQEFEGAVFLAPVIGMRQVQIRIASIICQLDIKENMPNNFYGWAILRATSTSKALFLRQATLGEIDAYVRLFPMVKLIVVQKKRTRWLALPAHRGDRRFEISGQVSLWLPHEGLNRFDTVLAAFDGRYFWYRDRDSSRNPALGAYLREQIIRQVDNGLPPTPNRLHKSGLSAEERQAYGFAWMDIYEERRDQVEVRLQEALAHAGAELREYSERGDTYVVRYEVDGRSHISSVRQEDLSVMTAGICLAGQDRFFDLTSLVGVLREAEQQQMIWVGDNALPENRYWQIHPPEDP